MQPDSELRLAELASVAHGVFTSAHAQSVGFTRQDIQRRHEKSLWTELHRGVYRHTATPLTWQGALLAACWAGGFRAAASHRSAAKLWGLPGGRDDIMEIICPRWRRARHDGLLVHESKALRGLDITEIDKIPATTVESTILGLGAVCSPRTVEKAVENALRRELATLGSFKGLLHRVGRQGRNGVGVLRSIIYERDPEQAATESEMETALLQSMRAHGLPTPVRQYVIRDALGNFIARADLAIVEWKVALEYESIEWHTGKDALLRDTPRRRKVMAAGWLPLGVTVEDLRDGGYKLCMEISAHARRAS
jgi:hypothetical protein